MHTSDSPYRQPDGPLWISAGEPSGDMHGALLIQALKDRDPGLHFTGQGGEGMASKGCEIRHGMDRLSLMGISGILSGLPDILRMLKEVKRDLMEVRPRGVVLIDCPEYNFRVAKIAYKLGIPVYYHISPQIWAWRSGRVKFLKKHVRKMLCILPFEKAFYEERGMSAESIGHPIMDQLPLDTLDAMTPEPTTLGILPGSRTREISNLLPAFAQTAQRIATQRPVDRILVVRAPGRDEAFLRQFLPDDFQCEFIDPEGRYEAMRRSHFLLACSGTVTLETALIGTPALLAYKMPTIEYKLSRWIVNVEFAGLASLILDEEVYPEIFQEHVNPEHLSTVAISLMDAGPKREKMLAQLALIREKVGKPGAPGRAAKIILQDLSELT